MSKTSDMPEKTTTHSTTMNPIESPKTRYRLGLWCLFSILFITLLGSTTYIMLTKQGLQKTQDLHTQSIQTALSTLAKQQQLLSDNLNSTNELIQAKQIKLQNQLNALINHVESSSTYEATQKKPWLLKKVRFYLELAQINSHWGQNQETSIMLLQEADALLQKIPDERLYSVKQTIAEEIASLKSIPPLDVAALMRKLDQAQAKVSQLPFKPLKPTPKPQTTSGSWQAHWQANLDLLKQLIVVRHHKPGEAPTLTPMYQMVLRERISMALQEAQWAVLQNNAQVYQQSLARIIHCIQHSYTSPNNLSNHHPKINDFLTQIRQLQRVQLSPAKPIMTQSLIKLNNIIKGNPVP